MNEIARKLGLALAVTLLSITLATSGVLAKRQLVMWDWWDARADLYAHMAERYAQLNEDVEIVIEVVPWDEYWPRLAIASTSGVGPDLAEFHNEQYPSLEGLLAPFPDDLFPKAQMRSEYLHFEQAFELDGEFYYMPGGVMTAGIFYNTDIMSQAGYDGVPSTWDELLGAARRLTRLDGQGQMVQAGFSAQDMGLLLDLIYQNGGYLFGDDGVTWGEAPGRQAVRTLADIYRSGVSDTPRNPLVGSFESGHVAMRYNWTWFGRHADEAGVNWDVAPLPTYSGDRYPARGRNNYESAMAVMAFTSEGNQRAAFEFIKWLNEDDEFIVQLNQLIGRIPGRTSTWNHPELHNSRIMRMLIETAPTTVFAGPIPEWTWGVLYDVYEPIALGELAPEVALERSISVGNAHFQQEPPRWIVERNYQPPTK